MASLPVESSALPSRDSVSISSSFRRSSSSFNRRESGVLSEADLPVAQIYDPLSSDGKVYGNREEIQLWNPEWSKRINREGEKFLEEAVCLGYQEDQSLAVLFVCSFDLKMARDRLPKFRNTCIPVWPERDKITFQELLTSRSKNFSSFRNTTLSHISVKELISYYYYQKMVKKRSNSTVSVLNRRAMVLARNRLIQQNLTTISPTQIAIKPGCHAQCNSCFKLRTIVYRILDDFVICTDCYAHHCRYKKLPEAPAKDPVLSFPSITPIKSSHVSGPITTSEIRASQVKCLVQSSYRNHRRQLQNLATAKKLAPNADEQARVMNQIHNILADENEIAVITLDD